MAAGTLGLSRKLLKEARTRVYLRRGLQTQQLDPGHRASPLVHDARGDDAVARADDGAPDVPCRGAAGQVSMPVALLRAGGWTLLRYEPTKDARILRDKCVRIVDVVPNAELRDDGGYVHAEYGFAQGDVALIRPGGYTGMLASGDGQVAQGDHGRQFA